MAILTEDTCSHCGEKGMTQEGNELRCNSCGYRTAIFMNEDEQWLEDYNKTLVWDDTLFDDLPAVVGHEYFRLKWMFDHHKVYAAIVELKDVYECAMKFAVLCAAAEIRDPSLTAMLLPGNLSVGTWELILRKLCQVKNRVYVIKGVSEPLRAIIDDLDDLVNSGEIFGSGNRFSTWRNEFLGHGALGFSAGEKYKNSLKKMAQGLAKHFSGCREHYKKLTVLIDGKPTWEEKQNLQEIEEERNNYAAIGKLDIWYAEKMCQALAEESRIFKEEDYRYYSPERKEDLISRCNLYACLDPASSTNPAACYRAITLVGVDADNLWFILDVAYGRWDSAETIEKIFHFIRTYGLKTFHIEKGWYIQVIEPFLNQEMQKRNCFFNVVPLEHAKQGSKLERIKILQPRFKAHTVYFPDKADWLSELKTELAGVTKDEIKSEYIDCVDALAMTEQVALPPVNSQISYNETFKRAKIQREQRTQSLFEIAGY